METTKTGQPVIQSYVSVSNEVEAQSIRLAVEEERRDNTLCFGHEGSSGINASPHLKTEKTDIIYSTQGTMYIPTIFGVLVDCLVFPKVK